MNRLAQLEWLTGASYTDPGTGRTTTGRNHIAAAAKQGVKAPENPTDRHTEEYGFEVYDPETDETRIVNRDQAEVIARYKGQMTEEPKRGFLHSDEVKFKPVPWSSSFQKKNKKNPLKVEVQK